MPSTGTASKRGEGIYVVDVDPATGKLANVRSAVKTPSPTWLAMTADGKFLYAANEDSNFNHTNSGSVSAFAVDAASGKLTPLNVVSSQGGRPAYISLHPSGKFLLVANYAGGSLSVLPVEADGALGEAIDVVHPNYPLNPARADDDPPGNLAPSDHKASHVHMIATDPSGNFVIADDAGLDQILVFRLDLATGKLSPNTPPATAALPGSAPRHFAFNADGTRFYEIHQQDSMLASYDFDPHTGALTFKQRVSALPQGFAGSNLASELLISKDGRTLYVGNRLHNSIAVFSAEADGNAKMIGELPTEGDSPRSLALDPSGKFLYSLNQEESGYPLPGRRQERNAEFHRVISASPERGDNGVRALKLRLATCSAVLERSLDGNRNSC